MSARQYELTLLQERSAGTFARVYLAEASGQDGIGRIVAVKVLKEQWSESSELLDRTRDEARLLARLHHRNILRVEAMAEIDGQPAIVMEFVDGVDLKQLIEKLAARGERIPPRAAYKIAHDTASALEAAYFKAPYGRAEALRVVHRDVKPSNVMVSVEGDVKVLDFGTARFNHEARLARTGVLRFGSMKYMSPERRVGDRGDHPSDIYALGLVLLEMLRGELLPLLPLERADHDNTLADLIARLDNLGLPNKDWEDSLRQTLTRITAAEPEMRLTASQIIPLLRAFADQANGHGLDSFATSTVARVAEEVYGKGSDGALSGSRLFVALGAGEGRTADPNAPAPRPSLPDPASSQVQPVAAAPARNLAASPPPPTKVEAPQRVAEPAPPAERPRSAPVPTEAWTAPLPAAVVEPPAPPAAEAPRSSSMMLVAVFLLVVVLGGLLVAVGGVGLYFYLDEGTAPATTPVAAAPAPSPAAAGHAVTIGRSDDTLQWIRLEDAAGNRLLNADPSATAAIPAGTYTLSAKIVGKAKVSAPLAITGPLTLSCGPAADGGITCADPSGAPVLTLPPG